jgi:cobalt-zinc-cadmium resistance protein CzcA
LLRKNVRERHNPVVLFFERTILGAFKWVYSHQKMSLFTAVGIMMVTFSSTKFLGTEFLPQLNEGALWVESELPMSISLPEAKLTSDKMIQILRRFPEVKQTLSQIGRTNDGTDPKGFLQRTDPGRPEAEGTVA